MYFELRKSRNPIARQRHYFVLVHSGNGEVLMTSEMYFNRSDAIDTINSIKRSMRNFTQVKGL